MITAMGIPRHGEFQPFDDYTLPDHWCFHIYSYYGTLEIDGQPHPLTPGTVTIIPPATRMLYHYNGPSEHVYFHFQVEPSGSPVEVPVVYNLRETYASMDDRARRAVSNSMMGMTHARATLWSLLWDMSELSGSTVRASGRLPILVESAVKHIEQRLSGSIRVERICQEVGVSYGYLSRLFQMHLGCTVLEHVRNRRAEQALHLLQSTNLPIKAIARGVGVPDLSQFSRLMKEVKGSSPRELRKHRNGLASDQVDGP